MSVRLIILLTSQPNILWSISALQQLPMSGLCLIYVLTSDDDSSSRLHTESPAYR